MIDSILLRRLPWEICVARRISRGPVRQANRQGWADPPWVLAHPPVRVQCWGRAIGNRGFISRIDVELDPRSPVFCGSSWRALLTVVRVKVGR